MDRKLGKKKLLSYKKSLKKILNANPIIKNTFYVLVLLSVFSLLGILKVGLREEKYITVIGNHISSERNELVKYIVTVTHSDKSKQVSQEQSDKKSNNLIEAAKSFGIDPLDIKLVSSFLYEEKPQINSTNTRVKPEEVWMSSKSVEIVLRDLEKSIEFSNLLTSFEGLEIYGPNYFMDVSKVDEARLLSKAMEDATEKAKFITKTNNKWLVKIISIEEVGNANFIQDPSVLGIGNTSKYVQGTTTVTKSVRVKFSIR